MTTHELTTLSDPHCPSCGTLLDAATNASSKDRSAPKPGDLSVCIDCGCILSFTETGYATVSGEELAAFPRDVRITLERARSVIVKRRPS